ncbi:cilia- and flagella-associated protein 43-like [Paramacrobiotus metropolitanus]|uniref:cilia- and flagella-associated protein 43-like n=1 Tax=Paramacrobiotus metropolitanus TaxID=2943436 RepID=UPI002445F916|nr:cilia- and flagella-associated protein 43-like [Paramacrobiotus metropolitanus]
MTLSPDTVGTTIFVKGPLGADLQFVNNTEFGYTCGQCVRFLSTSDLHPRQKPKDKLFHIPFREYGFLRTVPGKAFFSLTALQRNPLVFIYKYPEFIEVSRIDDNTVGELLDVAFTYTKLLLILTGQPECQITIWNWDTQVFVSKYIQRDLYSPNLHLSCSPCNWRDFCITSDSSIRIFTIDHGLPEEDKGAPVTCERPFIIPYDDSSQARQIGDLFQSVHSSNPADFLGLAAIAQVPPNVSESFIDEVLGRKRFTPTCHSWHVDGALYIGTLEGKLLYFNLHHGVAHPNVLSYTQDYGAPVKQILSFKEGTVVLSGNGDVDVLKQHSPTDVSHNPIIRLEENFTQIWSSPSRAQWLGITINFDLMMFHPSGTLDKHLLSRDEIAPYTYLEKFHDGCFLSIQEPGVLKIWNNDNEALLSLQLSVQVTVAAICPAYRCICLGTDVGYLYFVDCLKSAQSEFPRMVHKMRLFSAAVVKLLYNSTGKIIFAVGENDPMALTILSGLPSRKWNVMGIVKMSMAVDGVHSVYSNDGSFVLVTLTDKPKKGATDVVTFQLTNALLQQPDDYLASPLHDFDDTKLNLRRLKLKVPVVAIELESPTSAFLVTSTKHLAHASTTDWMKAPDLIKLTESLPFPICHLKLFPGAKYVLTCNKQGTTEIRLTDENFTLQVFDTLLTGTPRLVIIKQRGLRNRVFMLTAEGRLVCRSLPVVNELVTDVWVKQTDEIRIELEALSGLSVLDRDFLLPLSSPVPVFSSVSEAEEEPWLEIKTRLHLEDKAVKDSLHAEGLKEQYAKLKKKLLDLYTKNTWKIGLERLAEVSFELLDPGWITSKKRQESEIIDAKVRAALEIIEQELYKERLLARYWNPLDTKLRGLHGLLSDRTIKNFPIRQRAPNVKVMEERVRSHRYLCRYLDHFRGTNANEDNRESMKNMDENAVFVSGHDYVKQTIQLLCKGDESQAELFSLLYDDDTITSRFQRIEQLLLLRSSGILIKEAFNRRFDTLLNDKVQLLSALHHNYELIQKAVAKEASEMHHPNMPKVEFALASDENPGHELYQVTDEQILERMKRTQISLPFFLDVNDLNYPLIMQSRQNAAANAARTRAKANAVNLGKSLSALRIASHQPKITMPVEEILINPDELARSCDKMITTFEQDLENLQGLKERAVFAASLLDLRAMYIRQRLLHLEQVKAWTADIQHRWETTTKLADYIKANGSRSHKMMQIIRQQYEDCARKDAALDFSIKRELHDLSDLDGKRLVSMYRKRPHLFRGLKQATYFEGQMCRPRTAELKEKVTEEFYHSLRMIEDPEQRPEDIDYRIWHRYCEHRRKKMESEMEFWLKHMELELYQGLHYDYIELERALQTEVENAQSQLGEVERKQIMLEKNTDLVLTVTHGQIEAELAPFQEFNERVILIQPKHIQNMNLQLQNGCRKKMKVLEQVVKFREAILLLQWEREVQMEKIVDYQYERNFISSQVAPREIRNMVGKDLNEYRDQTYLRLKQNLRQQKATFKRNLDLLEYKLQLLYKKLVALENERHNAEATMRGLSCELQERQAVANDIGVQSDVIESETRRNLIWRRLRIQAAVKQQKKRMEFYKEELFRWQKRTFPAIYQDKRNP